MYYYYHTDTIIVVNGNPKKDSGCEFIVKNALKPTSVPDHRRIKIFKFSNIEGPLFFFPFTTYELEIGWFEFNFVVSKKNVF